MAGASPSVHYPTATLIPLGDSAILVRFASTLTQSANSACIAFARTLDASAIAGVDEVVPNLVSVLLRYDPLAVSAASLMGELRLLLSGLQDSAAQPRRWIIPTRFDGVDVDDVAHSLGMNRSAFVAAHNAAPLRILATGFAPGFVYCGMHPDMLNMPRRKTVRPMVPAGSLLFAAGQTAIAATDMPTGWHVIGRTDFRNFNPATLPPTQLMAGDEISFEAVL